MSWFSKSWWKAVDNYPLEEVKVKEEEERCNHDWVAAGPKTDLRTILKKIEGIKVTADETSNFPWTHLRVSILGKSYLCYGDSVPASSKYERWDYVRPTWQNIFIQGTVCLNCGVCHDRIKNTTQIWEERVLKKRVEQQEQIYRKHMAEAMWKDCEDRKED